MSRSRDPFEDFFRDDDMGSVFDHFDRLFDSMMGGHRRGGDPYDPRDPFDGFFGGFFGDRPPFGRGPPRGPPPRGGGGGGPRAEADVPDLSLINPNANPPSKERREEYQHNHHQNDVWSDIREMFGPNFGDVLKPDREPRLGDINPDIYNRENSPIARDDNSSPFGLPPGFRSPYLPNDTGEENEIPQSYFRSYSSVTYTNENGQSETRTTVRDGSGERTTVTRRGPDGEIEEFDENGNSTPPNILAPPSSGLEGQHPFQNRGFRVFPTPNEPRGNYSFDNGNAVTVHDPLGVYREKARNLYWKYWPFAGIWRGRRDDPVSSGDVSSSSGRRPVSSSGSVEWKPVEDASPASWLNKIRKE